MRVCKIGALQLRSGGVVGTVWALVARPGAVRRQHGGEHFCGAILLHHMTWLVQHARACLVLTRLNAHNQEESAVTVLNTTVITLPL